MAAKLLKKELKLCLHPAAVIMLGLTLLILIPGYPYTVSFFYVMLGLFFIAQGARENHDVTFTLTLPVERRAVVDGRFLLTLVLELCSLVLAGLMIAVHNAVMSAPNPAGMEANIVLIGEGLFLFGVFNLIFYTGHFRDVNRIGVPFIAASAAVFLLIVLEVISTYAVPFFRDVLDTPDPRNMGVKLAFDGVCLALGGAMTLLALVLSRKRFEKLDIR
jgi:hypothetical protein